MRGAQVFMESLLAHGVECIFGNPGTTENSLLDRLIDYPQIQYYVALHEGVAVGAANFYTQASGKTAVANLHVAPGLGNAIGMMYGALKSNSPIVVTAGQQDTRMRLRNPLLSHDLVAMAAPVTKFSAEPQSADEMGPLMRRAFKIANETPCGPVFIALPVNVMEQETTIGATTSGQLSQGSASADLIAQATRLITSASSPCIVTGDDPARAGAFDSVVSLAETIGAPVYHEGLRAQLSFPNKHPSYRGRVPFTAKETAALLSPHDLVVFLGGPFFEDIWHDEHSAVPDGARIIQIENNNQQLAFNFPVDLGIYADLASTLADLVTSMRGGDTRFVEAANTRNAELASGSEARALRATAELEGVWNDTPMAPFRALHELAKGLPEGTIVVDESITAFSDVARQFDFRRPGDYFAGRGGGIGQGIAGAIGTQVACPDRRVVALSGDGSAMYSIQALWTAAHHELPIVFVILSNGEYRVLKHNLDTYRRRFDILSDKPYPHMNLNNPPLDFIAMAKGMGIAGEVVSEAVAVADSLQRALSTGKPYVLEIVVAGKP
ncbi:MAG: benzoylformate decarboxylase [Gammaproteobacteria bacterium]|jgi:benzoylformate decarboxylase